MLKFDQLQTPPDDGDILIAPAGSHWPRLLEENRHLRKKWDFSIAGFPVHQVRQKIREALLGMSEESPIVAAGHQPEFIHPGVWAKHVVVHQLAADIGATGIDFVVDNDSPATSAMQLPVIDADGLVGTRGLAFTNAPADSAYEGRDPLDRTFMDSLRRIASAIMESYSYQPMLDEYLDGFAGARAARDVVEQHLAGRSKIDSSLSADLGEIRVSDAFGGPFVADLLLHADRFAEAYNQSLAEYRRQQRVRAANRPLPDLARDGNRIETPFWIYQPMHRRLRLWIEPEEHSLCCYADGKYVGNLHLSDLANDVDGALAELQPWVIRPRALTLTLWARLLVCDLFVHGIGGAKYDRITDGIFRRYYGCEPPAYTCVSATLRLPLPRRKVSVADLTEARRQCRDLMFNPDRYLPHAPAELVQERWRLIHESDHLREIQGPRLARRQTFLDIRRINADLIQTHPDIDREMNARLELYRKEVQSNRVADSREFFYALQPQDRLAMLADRLRKDMIH